jgi:hypothetical protein
MPAFCGISVEISHEPDFSYRVLYRFAARHCLRRAPERKACEPTTGDVTAPNASTSTCEANQSPLDRDHRFDNGSGIVLKQLSTVQIQNLATLGKV